MLRWLVGFIAVITATGVQGQSLGAGTYVLEGGSYSIQVSEQDGRLIVTEPNKTSTYTRASDGSYQFTNPNNGVTYALRVVDDHTLQAFKPGGAGAPTTLVRLGGPPSGEPAPADAQSEHWSELASNIAQGLPAIRRTPRVGQPAPPWR